MERRKLEPARLVSCVVARVVRGPYVELTVSVAESEVVTIVAQRHGGNVRCDIELRECRAFRTLRHVDRLQGALLRRNDDFGRV